MEGVATSWSGRSLLARPRTCRKFHPQAARERPAQRVLSAPVSRQWGARLRSESSMNGSIP